MIQGLLFAVEVSENWQIAIVTTIVGFTLTVTLGVLGWMWKMHGLVSGMAAMMSSIGQDIKRHELRGIRHSYRLRRLEQMARGEEPAPDLTDAEFINGAEYDDDEGAPT